MLKITIASTSNESTVLRLEGRLVSDWIGELLSACRDVRPGAQIVELDVAGLSFVDSTGIETLRELASQGLRIVNASPFFIEQMRER